MKLKQTELHVHLLQSLYPEDLFLLAKDCYREINWNRFDFLDRYEKIFGIRLDPVAIFDRAVKTGSLKELEEISYYKFKGEGNFDEFDIKSFFPICITGYYFDKNDPYPILQMITDRHKKEGIKYIEYRMGFGGSKEEWIEWNANFARFLKNASTKDFTAKYIVRLGIYNEFKEMMELHPDIVDTVVGVDFSGREIDPLRLKEKFYDCVNQDRIKNPRTTPDVVVHIGENFYDKSLETAIRWCHQSALFGATRLAHCIVLGIDPMVAISRQDNAHEQETVAMRISQIKYDLEYKERLEEYGIIINENELLEELKLLQTKDENDIITRKYDEQRLNEVSKRQDFVLDELKKLGTVIEVCPTSNLCIGGVPSIATHPFPKLFKSGVDLVICSDDPGIFGSSLSNEVDFVFNEFGISKDDLLTKLKDPYQFRLKK